MMQYSSSGPRKKDGRESRFDSLISFWAQRRRLPFPLVKGIIKQESDFVTYAKNLSSGAKGLMQLTDVAIRDVQRMRIDHESDLDIFPYSHEDSQVWLDADTNIAYGSYYFKHRCLAFWPEIPDPVEQVRFALLVYNAGVGHGQVAAQAARESCGQPGPYAKWKAEGSPPGAWQNWHYYKNFIGAKPAPNGRRAKVAECVPYVELVEKHSREFGGIPF